MGDGKYREEVRRGFERDESEGVRIGQVWKLDNDGKDAKEIAKVLRVNTHTFVYKYKTRISAIEEGELPSAPSPAIECGRALRSFSRRHRDILSNETRLRIAELAEDCDRIAEDPRGRATEERQLRVQTASAEKREIAGIYVYSMQHYLNYPVEPSDENPETDDRTFLKVGRSKDVRKRVNQQSYQSYTPLPEPLVLLRIYAPNSEKVEEVLKDVERKMHSHLISADHPRNRQKRSGTEWFLTHLKFLDDTARLLDLRIIDPGEHMSKD